MSPKPRSFKSSSARSKPSFVLVKDGGGLKCHRSTSSVLRTSSPARRRVGTGNRNFDGRRGRRGRGMMKLGKAKALRTLNDHYGRIRHVYTHFHNGCGNKDIYLLSQKSFITFSFSEPFSLPCIKPMLNFGKIFF